MTRPVRHITDIPQLALDLRRAGELLLHPCNCTTTTHRWRTQPCITCHLIGTTTDPTTGQDTPCPDCWPSTWTTCQDGHITTATGKTTPCPLCKPHSLGEHLWRSTLDMAPGTKAAATDTIRSGPSHEGDLTDDDRPPPPDPTLHLHDQLLTHATTSWNGALDLLHLIQQHRPDRETEVGAITTDDDWCRSCLRLGICSPRFRGDLCHRPCYEFHQVTHQDPPEWLVQAWHEGRHITQQMMNQAIREVKPRKKRKKTG